MWSLYCFAVDIIQYDRAWQWCRCVGGDVGQEAAGVDSYVPRTLGPGVLRREADSDDDVYASSTEHNQGCSVVSVASVVVVV